MTRILRFNESRLPTQVSQSEFFKKRQDHKMCDFSPSERSQIIEILRNKGISSNTYIYLNVKKTYSFSIEYIEITRRNIEVIKLDDEWFTIIEGHNGPFYICDEFEELINYLKQL